jgi:hypothetical protein
MKAEKSKWEWVRNGVTETERNRQKQTMEAMADQFQIYHFTFSGNVRPYFPLSLFCYSV